MIAYGGPEVMKYQDLPDTTAGAGDVVVRWPVLSKRKGT